MAKILHNLLLDHRRIRFLTRSSLSLGWSFFEGTARASLLIAGMVRALCLVAAFRQVACRNQTDQSFARVVVQDPPIMVVVGAHNHGIKN